jgi:hypothetical protein
VSTKVQEILNLAPRLVGPARDGTATAPPQRLDDGPLRRPRQQQDTQANHIRPQSDALPDLHKVQSGCQPHGLVVLVCVYEETEWILAPVPPLSPAQHSIKKKLLPCSCVCVCEGPNQLL